MYEETGGGNIKTESIRSDIAWAHGVEVTMLAHIETISSRVTSFTVGDEPIYCYDVNNVTYKLKNKKKAIAEYNDLVGRLEKFYGKVS